MEADLTLEELSSTKKILLYGLKCQVREWSALSRDQTM